MVASSAGWFPVYLAATRTTAPGLRFCSMSLSDDSLPSASHSPPGIPADRAFWELVFYNPTTCSRCFSLIRDRDDYRPDTDGGVSSYAPRERFRLAFDGSKGYDFDLSETVPDYITPRSPIPRGDYLYGYRPFHHYQSYCGSCGSHSGKPIDSDTLSKHQAKDYAFTLADRLIEEGVCVEHDHLSYCVGKFKGYRNLASLDIKIFARSTKIAIEHARR